MVEFRNRIVAPGENYVMLIPIEINDGSPRFTKDIGASKTMLYSYRAMKPEASSISMHANWGMFG